MLSIKEYLNHIIQLIQYLNNKVQYLYINFDTMQIISLTLILLCILLFLYYSFSNAYYQWNHDKYIKSYKKYSIQPALILLILLYLCQCYSNAIQISIHFSFLSLLLDIIPICIYIYNSFRYENGLLLPHIVYIIGLLLGSNNIIINYIITFYSIIMHDNIHINQPYKLWNWIFFAVFIIILIFLCFMLKLNLINIMNIGIIIMINIICYFFSDIMRFIQNSIFVNYINYIIFLIVICLKYTLFTAISGYIALNYIIPQSHKAINNNHYNNEKYDIFLPIAIVISLLGILTNTLTFIIIGLVIYIISNIYYQNNMYYKYISYIIYIILILLSFINFNFIELSEAYKYILQIIGLYYINKKHQDLPVMNIMAYNIIYLANIIIISNIPYIYIVYRLFNNAKYNPALYQTYRHSIKFLTIINLCEFILTGNITSFHNVILYLLLYLHDMKNIIWYMLSLSSLFAVVKMLQNYINMYSLFYNNSLMSIMNLQIPIYYAYIPRISQQLAVILLFYSVFNKFTVTKLHIYLLYISISIILSSLICVFVNMTIPCIFAMIFQLLHVFSHLYLFVFYVNKIRSNFFYLVLWIFIVWIFINHSIHMLPFYCFSLIPLTIYALQNKSIWNFILLIIMLIWMLGFIFLL